MDYVPKYREKERGRGREEWEIERGDCVRERERDRKRKGPDWEIKGFQSESTRDFEGWTQEIWLYVEDIKKQTTRYLQIASEKTVARQTWPFLLSLRTFSKLQDAYYEVSEVENRIHNIYYLFRKGQ